MNILVVDDNRLSLDVYRAAIRRLGDHDVAALTAPVEALAHAGAHNVDLLIVDYRMPGIDGLNFVIRFRALPGKDVVPIMMLTQERDRHVLHDVLALGVNQFMNKPADPVEFATRVGNLLELRRSRVALADQAESLANAVQRATAELETRERGALALLGRIGEYHDDASGLHQLRIGKYCALIARAMGCDERYAGDIELAASLHDIGKIAVPDAILLKRGQLGERERSVMQSHATIGGSMLSAYASPLMEMAARIAATHHERYDGTGYPAQLAGTSIPVEGRICAIADVFDAITSPRPYKAASSYAAGLKAIEEGAGTQFDPRIARVFLGCADTVLSIARALRDGGETAEPAPAA